MRLRRTIAGRSRALVALGALIALALSGPAAPAGADSTGAAPGRTAPKTVRVKTPKQSPAPGSMGRARPAPVFAKLRYDSLLSVNDQCPVRGGHLNPGIRPMYVNRHPVGFC
jgi:hypothetical protein